MGQWSRDGLARDTLVGYLKCDSRLTMHPRLVVIAGPLTKDSTFVLDSNELSIGRDPVGGICLTSNLVSRHHCLIRKQADLVSIHDTSSRNGTFVNGQPVIERVLEHGDLIKIGDTYFRFLAPGREELAGERPVEFEDPELTSCSTVALRREDVQLLRHDKPFDSAKTDRVVRDLQVLVTIATRIASVHESDALLWQVLGMVLDAIPAERGTILLCGDAPEDLTSTVAWDKRSGPEQPVRVSRTVVMRVLRGSAALLVNDISEDETLKGAPSLRRAQVRSILCAPLIWPQQTLGVIYLDTRKIGVRFDEGHLQLLTAIAGITAMALATVQRIDQIRAEAQRLQAVLDGTNELIGGSSAMRDLLNLIAKVAHTDSTVLVCGESGTGKELTARAIHRASSRRDGPFIAINCAAIPEALLESELFGYDKGAFTGAAAPKKGQIELANGGTLLLDEIGELAPALQAKLLRVLQEFEFTKVGGSRPIKVDTRVIAATNRDLAAAVKAGTFRQDLYYRLNVVSIVIPPLRDRREDISLLSRYFVATLSAKCKRRVVGISPEAHRCLMRYDWPGNVRELQNAIERAIVLGSSELILPEDLPESLFEAEPSSAEPGGGSSYQSAVMELKKQMIIKAIKEAEGNYTEAARSLRVNPTYLHRLIRNLNLKPLIRDLTA